MKVYYIGKMVNKELEETQLNDQVLKDSHTTLNTMRTGIKCSVGFSYGKEHILGNKALSPCGYGFSKDFTGVILLTDKKLTDEEFQAFTKSILDYKGSLNDLRNQLGLEDLRESLLLQVSMLPANVNKSVLATLGPLREKISKESNTETKKAAQLMLHSIEDAIILRLKAEINNEQFKSSFNEAVIKAKPVLEKLPMLKQLITDASNAITHIFSEKRYVFFSNPNTFQAETEGAKNGINAIFDETVKSNEKPQLN